MGQYSIKEIEQLTGIKAHTIRIWEQRYGFIEPHRTDTNIRFYDDEQLKLLLNISALIRNGRKISQVSKLSKDDIKQELQQLTSQTDQEHDYYTLQVDSMVVAMIDIDEVRFEKVISSCTLRYGFESVMTNLLIPFLHKVGLLWTTGEINVAQEHFITNLIRRKLLVAIDGHVGKILQKQKFILFLPDGELHEIGLLFGKYLIRSRGFPLIYLGQSVPLNDLHAICKSYAPDYLLTYFTVGYQADQVRKVVKEVSDSYPQTTFIISGPLAEAAGKKLPNNVVRLSSINEMITFLDNISLQEA